MWDLGAIGGLDGLRAGLKHQDALALVRAWHASYSGYWQLELRPSRGLDNRWLFQVLQGAMQVHPPHFPLPEPEGRRRWNWPLRIGFPASQDWMLRGIYEGRPALSPSVAPLTQPQVGPNRCDILLIGPADASLRGLAAESLPEAALVVVFLSSKERGDPMDARAFAARTNAAGVALVEHHTEMIEWLRTFLRELSHGTSVTMALRRAERIQGLLAASRLLDTVPVDEAAIRLRATLGMTAAMPAAKTMFVEAMPDATLDELNLPRGADLLLSAVREAFDERTMNYLSETQGASHVAEVARAAVPAFDELERGQAKERFIRAAIHVARAGEWARLRHGFEAGRPHRIAVSIGPRDSDLIIAATPVPRELEEAAGHRLTIVLSEPTFLRKPLVGTVFLPKFGSTENVDFTLPARRSATSVRARIIVLHRGRILQTSILKGPVHARAELERVEADGMSDEPRIRILPEVNLRPGFAGLDDRTRFHSAIVLNENGDGQSGATAVGKKDAITFDLNFVKDAVTALSAKLKEAERDGAFKRKLDSVKSLGYLRMLALEGRTLYKSFGKAVEKTFGDRPERLQVLSANPNTMLPVELIYDLPPPVRGPKLCPNSEAALETGRCDPRFHVKDVLGQLDVVCPSGFWGISKIIEREAADPKTEPTGFVVRSAPSHGKETLGQLVPLLFAASDHVNDVDKKELGRVSRALTKLTGEKATRVETWIDWATNVRDTEPPLLLLLSHTETEKPDSPWLEIAKVNGTETRTFDEITDALVNLNDRRPGPIVLLLGCSTFVPLDKFQTATVSFAQEGAPVVIGTIAPVLGRHAGRTAEALIGALQTVQAAAGSHREVPIGEALRDVRRAMLAKGIIMAMSLAAYGDADWRLPAPIA